MARIRIVIAGGQYEVPCEDGAETRLSWLAGMVEDRAGQLRAQGAAGGRLLMLLTALRLADELTQALDRATAAEDMAARLHAELTAVEATATEVVDAAVRQIEAITKRLE